MKRPKSFIFNFKAFINDIWTHIYGIITVISFLVALFFTIFTLNKQDVDFKDVLYVCLGIITVLSFVIIRISTKYSQLHNMSADLLNYERENSNLITLIQLQAETTHNITHYYRNLEFLLDSIIQKINNNDNDNITEEDIASINEINNQFLTILTSSLQNYFSIYTDDNCSISIKSLNRDKNKLKTIFRDPVNLKKRKQAEQMSGISSYETSQNTAFDVILSETYKNYYYANDDLSSEYTNHKYKNCNINWNSYYNSTIVVPISLSDPINIANRNILGFLTVDNRTGYLTDDTSVEYMHAISDLLYNYFYKYTILSEFSIRNNIKNDRQHDFLWH